MVMDQSEEGRMVRVVSLPGRLLAMTGLDAK